MNDNRFRVLVIEPDEQELETTKTQLKEMGITVRSAHSFAECNDLLDAGEVRLVLARLCSSPDETLTSCALVRARCAIPIILLVGRGTIVDEDRIIAAGADDYIITPSSTRIFAARLNHQRTRTSTRHRTDGDTLVWANLLLDTTGRHCLIGDIEIHLTSSEYRLLELLLTDRQRVHTRTQIADAIGSYAGSSSSHSVDAHVSRLRKKITENGCPDPIRVVRGVGFGLAAIPPPVQ
jgi:DNA-binding response OmpR family regulator